jgi:hypothetical protein
MKQITDVEKNLIKQVFTAYISRKNEIKELNTLNSEDIKDLANKIDVKGKEIRSAFRFLIELENEGESSLDEVVDLFEKVRS